MQNLSMCRICLATDVRLCSISSSLQVMYEKITELTFKTEDRRPLVACCICHARLRNCYRLRTSCLQSEELLTDMLTSGQLVPQQVSSTNTLRVVSVLHFSLENVRQGSTQCRVKNEAPEVIHDAEIDQQNNEDMVTEAQKEKCKPIDDYNQCFHLEDPLDVMKEEADDVETDDEYINVEQGNINIEDICWEPDIAGPSSQSADSVCPKIVKVLLERIDLNDFRFGARMKNTEDGTTDKIKIEVEKPKLLKTCDKVDVNLNKYDDNVLTSIANDVCKEKSSNDTSVEQNVSSVSSSKSKPFSCYNRKDKLKTHIRKYTGDKPFQCNVCEKCLNNRSDLKKHIRSHTGEKPFQCYVCEKCFTQKNSLKIHIRTHTGEKPYQCNICKKCFNQKVSLVQHIRSHTGEKPFECNVCKKCFNHKGDLKKHVLSHTGEKPFQCNVCEKCFTQKGSLERHIRTHTGEKPFECNVCKKCFNNKGVLKKHILSHTGEKPFQCNVCEKYFTQKGYLHTHIRTHTGEKPFECNVCKKCFSHKSTLKNHIWTHTGEKPYQCNSCKKCFRQKSALKTHIGTHTGEKPY